LFPATIRDYRNEYPKRRTLMMSPRLNFSNIIRTASTIANPKSIKRYWWFNCIFYAYGIYKRKRFSQNVGEIDTCHWFHHNFTRTFFVQIFCQSQNLIRKSCWNDLRTKNLYVKTLMKLTPSFTFKIQFDRSSSTIILRTIRADKLFIKLLLQK
jgi:hypothetical protein